MKDGNCIGTLYYNGWNRMHHAVATSQHASTRDTLILLSRSVVGQIELRLPDDKGRLPIHIATLTGNVIAVKTLSELAPDTLLVRDCNGDTPMQIAQKLTGPEQEEYLKKVFQEQK